MSKVKSFLWFAMQVVFALIIIGAIADLIAKFAGFNAWTVVTSPLSQIPNFGTRQTNSTAAASTANS